MIRALRIAVFALIVAAAGLLASPVADALLAKHECTFCHSLHGATGSSSFVPQNSPTNIEVLCMGCHLTAIDGTDPDTITTDPVQPHRTAESAGSAGFMGEYYVTCNNCHDVHDNQPNWLGAHLDADNTGLPPPEGWVEGTNAKMIGRTDPDATTPYAIIQTLEADFDKNGLPDRDAAVTVTCDDTIQNDCFVQGKRHVVFENYDPEVSGVSIHGFSDGDEDGIDDTTAIGAASNVSDSGINYSPYDGVCEICHSQTANHNIAQGKGLTHNSARACTACHLHSDCFDKGGPCATAWTVPNRDLQVDLVSAAPASVDAGQTVTITVDVTNLGDNVEDIQVRYASDIEGNLGFSTAAGVASGGSAQTSLNWVTVEPGAHTVTADIVPVIGETVIGNNTGTDTVTVAALDNHDVAVTSVTAPSPILQGSTETVSVDIANPGTFTETFDVVLYDNTDDPGHASPIGTLSSSALAPSGTATLNFSWNTTGASLGTHTLEAIADTVTGETNTANNSATTTSTVAIHDVTVSSVTAPPSVDQGTTATVNVDIANLSSTGGFSETFDVTLFDDTDTVTIGTQSSGALAGGGSTTLNFSWNTTGASIATHTLRAVAATVPGETITANNTATTTSNVIVPVAHDVAVDSVTAPATVDRGTAAAVDVVVTNNGGAVETFNVTLSSNLDGTIQTLSSGALGIGASTTLNFSWVTDPTTSLGAHTLTAVAATVAGETNTADNTSSTSSTVTSHDVAVNSVTAPASTAQGNTAAVDVSVTNQGSFTETFNVTLVSNLDGTIQTLSSGALAAGATTVLNFSWDTTGATIATHTLTATAATVAGELDTADNAASTTADVVSGVVHDVAVLSVTGPVNPIKLKTNPTNVTISVVVENQGGATETFDVTLVSDLDGVIGTLSSGALAAGAQTTLDFVWSVTSAGNTVGLHTLTATAATVPGETDTADNTGTGTVTFQ